MMRFAIIQNIINPKQYPQLVMQLQSKQCCQILVSLPNTTELNQDYCYSLTQTGSYFNPISQLQTKQPKQLYLQFQLKPLESIRLNKQNNKSIMNLVLGQIQIYIKVIKDPCYFIFQQGLYRNYVVIGLVVDGQDVGQIGRKQISFGEWGKHVVAISYTIVLKNGKTKQLEECYPVLQIGDINKQKVLESKIRNLRLSTTKSVPQQQKQQKKVKTFEIHQGPLDTIPTNPIPPLSTLPPYSSLPQKPDKLYLCHDMAGGYIQDTNKHHPYPKATNKYKLDEAHQHTYRCLHLGQASIFNYFSHYLITIPPQHWRRICRTNRTLCLGTLIIEKQIPAEQDYLTQYMSDLLIFFCRKYKFDGYLINFQYAIKNVNKYLSPWLKKFVAALHEAVPNSRIIWYDSVIRNGKVSYQNQLNEHNEIFYKDTDGIFLNYWWNQQKLLRSLEHRVEGKMIYVGSDCFGRGTFGGGGYNTYKAIHAIKKIDKGSGNLAPALFAMGYTYQNNKNNIQAWKIHEKSMYQGVGFFKQGLPHNKWQYTNSNINGFTWQIQDEWAITSFQNCTRHLTLKLHQIKSQMANSQNSSLSVTFFTTVAGTGPKFEDIYKIKLILSLQGVVLNQVTTGQCCASEKEDIIQLKMDIDSDLITNDTDLVVVQEGHDVEKWGGHFGTRFKNDSIYFTSYSKNNDWISQYKTNFPNGSPLPYLTNYNLGHGTHFHHKGKKIIKNYDYMSDFDTNNAYIMNPPLNINICYNDSYMGGTCLAIEQPKKIKLGEFQIHNQYRNIGCRVVLKGVEGKNNVRIRYRFGEEIGMGCLIGEQKLDNLWVNYVFSFDLGAFNQQNQKLVLFLQTDNSHKYLLGQTAIFTRNQKTPIPQITQLILQLSQQNPPISPILFNLTIQTTTPCRLLLTLNQLHKNNPVFTAFAICDNLNNNTAIVKNMHGPAYTRNKLYVYCLNEQMQWKSIMQLEVDSKQLRCKRYIHVI